MPTPSKFSRNPDLTALGATIRLHRRELGISQEVLAERAGMDRSYVGQVERGENSVSMIGLLAIARVLNVTVATLMTEARL